WTPPACRGLLGVVWEVRSNGGLAKAPGGGRGVRVLQLALAGLGGLFAARLAAGGTEADSTKTAGRLVVCVSSHTHASVFVKIKQDSVVVREGIMDWDYPDQETEVGFSGLPFGTYQVEARATRRKFLEGLDFWYWPGTASRSVMLKAQKNGRAQRI